MQTGWFLDEKDGSWYYLQKTNDGSQGKMQTGWIKEGEAWYYLGPTGRMTKGWNWINGKCYYMDQKNGHMLADCVTPDGYTVRYRRLERNNGGGSVWKRKKEGDGWLDFLQSL